MTKKTHQIIFSMIHVQGNPSAIYFLGFFVDPILNCSEQIGFIY